MHRRHPAALEVRSLSVENLRAIFEPSRLTLEAPNQQLQGHEQHNSEERLEPKDRVREKIRIFEQDAFTLEYKRSCSLDDLQDLMYDSCGIRKSEFQQGIARTRPGTLKREHATTSRLQDTLLEKFRSSGHDDDEVDSTDGPPPPSRRRGRRSSHRRASTGVMPYYSPFDDSPSVELQAQEPISTNPAAVPTFHHQDEQATTEQPPLRGPKLERRASTGRVRFMEEPTVWEFTDGFATQIHP